MQRFIGIWTCVAIAFLAIQWKQNSKSPLRQSFTKMDEVARLLAGEEESDQSAAARAPASEQAEVLNDLYNDSLTETSESTDEPIDPMVPQLEAIEISKIYKTCTERANTYDRKTAQFAKPLEQERSIESLNHLAGLASRHSENWLGSSKIQSSSGQEVEIMALMQANEAFPICPSMHVLVKGAQGWVNLIPRGGCYADAVERNGKYYWMYDGFRYPESSSLVSSVLIPILNPEKLAGTAFHLHDSEDNWKSNAFYWQPISENDRHEYQAIFHSRATLDAVPENQQVASSRAPAAFEDEATVLKKLASAEIGRNVQICKEVEDRVSKKAFDLISAAESSWDLITAFQVENPAYLFTQFSLSVGGEDFEVAALARAPIKEPEPTCVEDSDGVTSCSAISSESRYFFFDLYLKARGSLEWSRYPGWDHISELHSRDEKYLLPIHAYRIPKVGQVVNAMMFSIPTARGDKEVFALAAQSTAWSKKQIQWQEITDGKRDEIVAGFNVSK